LRSQNIPVSQNMLKTKSLSIYEQLKNGGIEFSTIFEASNGWVYKFQQQFDISSKTISGESASADQVTIENCQVKQPTILIVDNCNAYSSPKLQNIKVEFLPPNTTSVIQPCDAAVDTSNVNDINDLNQLLEKLEMPYNCTKLLAKEYVNVDKEVQTIDTPTKESIVKEVLKEQGLIDNDNSNSEDEAEEEVIDDLITYNEGKGALEVAKKYLEQSQFATENDIYLLRQIIKKAE
ncbi:3010_t:CDS:2, partial [Racocetra fulgida]